jgi:hypothetical protein
MAEQLKVVAVGVGVDGGLAAKAENDPNPIASKHAVRIEPDTTAEAYRRTLSRKPELFFAGSRRPLWGPELESLELTLQRSNMRNRWGYKSRPHS